MITQMVPSESSALTNWRSSMIIRELAGKMVGVLLLASFTEKENGTMSIKKSRLEQKKVNSDSVSLVSSTSNTW